MDSNTIILVAGAVSLVTIVVLVVALTKIAALGKIVARLSEQIPGTGMTAKELAGELGGSIESSFQKFMPQPDKVSGAITSSVEAALKTASAGVEGVHKKLLDGQDAVLDKWIAHEKNSAASLEAVRKALETAAQQVNTGLTGGSQKMQASLDDGSKKLADALNTAVSKLDAAMKDQSTHAATTTQQLVSGLTGGSQKMQASLEDGSKKLADALNASISKLDGALKDHAVQTAKASEALSAQLEKIATLEKDIVKLLHLQEATQGTIKTVASSEEFKQLIGALRTHLEASDKLLREAAKPRTIRLVEQDS